MEHNNNVHQNLTRIEPAFNLNIIFLTIHDAVLHILHSSHKIKNHKTKVHIISE